MVRGKLLGMSLQSLLQAVGLSRILDLLHAWNITYTLARYSVCFAVASLAQLKTSRAPRSDVNMSQGKGSHSDMTVSGYSLVSFLDRPMDTSSQTQKALPFGMQILFVAVWPRVKLRLVWSSVGLDPRFFHAACNPTA